MSYDRVLRRMSGVAAVAASLGVAVLAVGITADVALRYFVGSGVPGMIEYAATLMVAVVFLGLAEGQRKGEHVGMTFLVDRLPRAPRHILPMVGLLAMALLLLWMTIETTGDVIKSYSSGEFRFGLIRVPLWPAKATIPIGLSLLLAETVRSVIFERRQLRHE